MRVSSARPADAGLEADAGLIDACLTRLTRRHGALSLALGQVLLALSSKGHQARLNVSSIHDFSRERLGLKSDRSRRLVRLAEGLPSRPLLHEAVLRGTVDLYKADVVLPVARGDEEPAWVHLAATESVERLEALVKARGYEVPEAFRSALVSATAEQRSRIELGFEVAQFTQRGRSRPLRLEALCQEYVGFFGDPHTYARAGDLVEALAPFWGAIGGPPAPDSDLSSDLPLTTRAGAAPGSPANDGRATPKDRRPSGACEAHVLVRVVHTRPGRAANDDASADPGSAPTLRDGASLESGSAEEVRSDTWERGWQADFLRHALEIDATLSELAGPAGPDPRRPAGVARPYPQASTAELRAEADRLSSLLHGRAEQMGRLLWLVQTRRLWRTLGHASFARYCRDRLLMEPRTARYHIRLEERLQERPLLRQALREGRLTFSKAEFLSRQAHLEDLEGAIEDAATSTLLELRRRYEEAERKRLAGDDTAAASGAEGNASGTEEGAQRAAEAEAEDGAVEKGNPPGTGRVKLDGPERIMALAEDALMTARIVAWLGEGDLISPGEALARIADHFVETWLPVVPKLKGTDKVLWERTGGWCAVPGCTGVWQDSHHIQFRSRGGSDAVWNLHPLCRFHHNQCLHGGHMRLRGRAGDKLVWELMTSLDDIATFIETGSGESRRVRRVETVR